MQKGFAHLFATVGVLIVFGILGLTYLNFSQRTSPPKQQAQKIYQNDEFGFELKILPGFEVKIDMEEDFNKRGNGDFRKNFSSYVGYEPAKVLGAVVALDKEEDFEKSPLTIWVFENPENLEAEKWFDKYWYYPFVWGDFTERRKVVAPVNSIIVDGREAKYGVVTYQPNSPKFIYLPFKKKMYLFRVLTNSNIGDQILSTFKFLGDDTTNWKIFSSKEFGFSIKYPDGYEVSQNNGRNNIIINRKIYVIGGTTNDFVYISVIPKGFYSTGGEIYNYNTKDTNLLLNMDIGEEKSLKDNPEIRNFFTYKRLDDIEFGGVQAKVYQNNSTWELPKTKERRIYIDHKKYLYLIGGYYTQESDDDLTLDLVLDILSTFKFLE